MKPALLAHVRGCVARLEQACPIALPVRVEICGRTSNNFGLCMVREHRAKKRYVIRIAERIQDAHISRSRAVTGAEITDTLAHEWAHAMAWGRAGSDHGPAWGRAYARAYRAPVDDDSDG